ncbi:unnamed protein product [Phyllotreta striolata]|uniref:CLIP domain-containing serine protease n=1 Tax=Phyllotreta striolata TaxID=444603 RepID=A0A9N9TLU9_PHYSR|nr:unnamed protein product [Phyllotreta striolata]
MKFIVINSLKWHIIYLVFNYCYLLCQSQSNTTAPCQTPDGRDGNCVNTADCASMSEVLTTIKRPLSNVAREQLQAYSCDNKAFRKVCCPLKGAVLIRESNVNLTAHRSFHLLPSECGYEDIAGKRIINGTDAELTEFPWMALLSSRQFGSNDFVCGGTIINERYVLTAAHCVIDKDSLVSVRLGEYDKNSPTDCYKDYCNDPHQDVSIEEVISHPNFNEQTLENDVALLRVAPIKFNQKNIRPICLPTEGEPDLINTRFLTLSGWGITKAFGSTSSVMQKADILVVDIKECETLYRNFEQKTIDERVICAGGGQNSSYACGGDSGGPVQAEERHNGVNRYVQLGIVSFGHSTCSIASTFTSVKFFMKWILDNMRQ